MAEVALLNPREEAPVAKAMVGLLDGYLKEAEHVLTHTVLDREAYLLTMGKVNALRSVHAEMQQLYRRSFET